VYKVTNGDAGAKVQSCIGTDIRIAAYVYGSVTKSGYQHPSLNYRVISYGDAFQSHAITNLNIIPELSASTDDHIVSQNAACADYCVFMYQDVPPDLVRSPELMQCQVACACIVDVFKQSLQIGLDNVVDTLPKKVARVQNRYVEFYTS